MASGAAVDACFFGDFRGERLAAGVGDDELATAMAPRGDEPGLAAATGTGLDDRGGVDCDAASARMRPLSRRLRLTFGFRGLDRFSRLGLGEAGSARMTPTEAFEGFGDGESEAPRPAASRGRGPARGALPAPTQIILESQLGARQPG